MNFRDVRIFRFATITDLDSYSKELELKNGKMKESGYLMAYLREGILILTRTGLEESPFTVNSHKLFWKQLFSTVIVEGDN